TRFSRDWSSDVYSSDLLVTPDALPDAASTVSADAGSTVVTNEGSVVVTVASTGDGGGDGELAGAFALGMGAIGKDIVLENQQGRSEERRVGKECRSGGA